MAVQQQSTQVSKPVYDSQGNCLGFLTTESFLALQPDGRTRQVPVRNIRQAPGRPDGATEQAGFSVAQLRTMRYRDGSRVYKNEAHAGLACKCHGAIPCPDRPEPVESIGDRITAHAKAAIGRS